LKLRARLFRLARVVLIRSTELKLRARFFRLARLVLILEVVAFVVYWAGTGRRFSYETIHQTRGRVIDQTWVPASPQYLVPNAEFIHPYLGYFMLVSPDRLGYDDDPEHEVFKHQFVSRFEEREDGFPHGPRVYVTRNNRIISRRTRLLPPRTAVRRHR